jgi:hypothetical protein
MSTFQIWKVEESIIGQSKGSVDAEVFILLVLIALWSRPGYIWSIWLRAIALVFLRASGYIKNASLIISKGIFLPVCYD